VKLISLYSNNEALFPTISFHDGLNVVFARVQDPTQKDRDSHNLGKTFLIEVIDFCLLKTADKSHVFRKFEEIFGDFDFYLQVLTDKGQWVTVRRSVQGKKPVSLFISDTQAPRLSHIDEEEWTVNGLSVPKGEEALAMLLNLTVLRPYDYRKGLGYVLRRQSDWDEVFYLERFRRGKDKDWKPFVAKLLGFEPALVLRKYDLGEQLSSKQQLLRALEQEAGSRSSEYDRVKGLIELKQADVTKKHRELEQFSFRELEAEVSQSGAQEIEEEIGRLNERRYTIDYEVSEIDRSLEANLPFDLERIQQVFQEAQLTFPDSLSKGYTDLIDFNRRVSVSRGERLSKLRVELLEERQQIESDLVRLDGERHRALRILSERETLQKYRLLQDQVRAQEAEIAELERRLDKLDMAATTQREIQELQAKIGDCAKDLADSVRKDNPTLSEIRRKFSLYVERVLNVPALLSVNTNDSGNLDFAVQTLDRSIAERETSEAAGTSYRKILCACFDLTLLSVYAKEPFYHFVYHDGVLEGLDNRKKVNLLELVRDVCAEFHLMYITSLIDSDLPRDERDQKLLFSQEEVVRELHDQGDVGRLFRMPAF